MILDGQKLDKVGFGKGDGTDRMRMWKKVVCDDPGLHSGLHKLHWLSKLVACSASPHLMLVMPTVASATRPSPFGSRMFKDVQGPKAKTVLHFAESAPAAAEVRHEP